MRFLMLALRVISMPYFSPALQARKIRVSGTFALSSNQMIVYHEIDYKLSSNQMISSKFDDKISLLFDEIVI